MDVKGVPSFWGQSTEGPCRQLQA